MGCVRKVGAFHRSGSNKQMRMKTLTLAMFRPMNNLIILPKNV